MCYISRAEQLLPALSCWELRVCSPAGEISRFLKIIPWQRPLVPQLAYILTVNVCREQTIDSRMIWHVQKVRSVHLYSCELLDGCSGGKI
jgi:hypothetical protein